MSDLKISAALWKISKDHEGEVTLSFKVPSSDKLKAMAIPENIELSLEITAIEGGQ